jgi:RNA polymerase sigma factor (sigma-70 family)
VTRPDSTTQLLRAIERGNSRALAELFERQASWLRRAAHGRLPAGARDRCDTTDLVHETLASVFRRLPNFTSRHPGALRQYVLKALRNRVRDEVRRVKAHPTSGQSDLDQLPSPMASPLDGMLTADSMNRFREALAMLSERDQLAVVSRQHFGYSYSQVAVVVGARSQDAARKIVTRALGRLAEQMASGEAIPLR